MGFVTNGGYDTLKGSGVAGGFCSAARFVALLENGYRVDAPSTGMPTVLVLVRNPSSPQFRPAFASLQLGHG